MFSKHLLELTFYLLNHEVVNSECLYKYNIYITYHMQNIYIKNIYRKYNLLNKIVYIYK